MCNQTPQISSEYLLHPKTSPRQLQLETFTMSHEHVSKSTICQHRQPTTNKQHQPHIPTPHHNYWKKKMAPNHPTNQPNPRVSPSILQPVFPTGPPFRLSFVTWWARSAVDPRRDPATPRSRVPAGGSNFESCMLEKKKRHKMELYIYIYMWWDIYMYTYRIIYIIWYMYMIICMCIRIYIYIYTYICVIYKWCIYISYTSYVSIVISLFLFSFSSVPLFVTLFPHIVCKMAALLSVNFLVFVMFSMVLLLSSFRLPTLTHHHIVNLCLHLLLFYFIWAFLTLLIIPFSIP